MAGIDTTKLAEYNDKRCTNCGSKNLYKDRTSRYIMESFCDCCGSIAWNMKEVHEAASNNDQRT